MLVPGLVDFEQKCLDQSLLGGGQVGPQRLERPRLGGLLSLQLSRRSQHPSSESSNWPDGVASCQ